MKRIEYRNVMVKNSYTGVKKEIGGIRLLRIDDKEFNLEFANKIMKKKGG